MNAIEKKILELQSLKVDIANIGNIDKVKENPYCVCKTCNGKGTVKTSSYKKSQFVHKAIKLGLSYSEICELMGYQSKQSITRYLDKFPNDNE